MYRTTLQATATILLCLLCGQAGYGADASTPGKTMTTILDEAPLGSPRADGMGGALSTLADDTDAAFHNPAGIGGLGVSPHKDGGWVRKLYFPWVSAAANLDSASLMHQAQAKGASNDSGIGEAVVDAHAGQRQYARATFGSGVVLGRTMVLPFTDSQIASTPRGQGSNLLDTHYRSMSGIGYGFSAQDEQGRLSLGYFGYAASRSDTEGAFPYEDMVNNQKRSADFKSDSKTYTGTGNNAGMIWRLGKKAAPALGLSVNNLGGAKFKGKDGTLVIKEDITAGFSLSPQFGKSGTVNLITEAGSLNDEDISLLKKSRAGAEYLIGGTGSYATFGIRVGYNYAGASAGVNLNLGLIGLEASTYCVDVAEGRSAPRISERRESAKFYVNVADF